jgi:leucyl-tRNA synthetase
MAKSGFNHKKVEKKWQKLWETEKIFEVKEKGDKFYILDMFAYPSGEGLHVGHPRGYTASDILAKYYMMQGKNVLHPFGWDAFGLPAENYAIKVGTHPSKTTAKNIVNFTKQLKSFGFGYDWSREINTSEPEYYKWTQWLFKVLYDNGYAYQKEAHVNWCPKDQTVLANEQVVAGCCERCGAQVEQKNMNQWFFKITDFAQELIDGLDRLDWPESTKEMQKNWIGRSDGAEIEFQVDGTQEKIKVFTTRPDTLFGVAYMVLAPEHELVAKITTSEQKKAVEKYVTATRKKSALDRTASKEKTGVFTGAYAINPANNEKIPIWVADYVLASYGFGAVMAVPAHDERDYEFAKQFDLPIIQVTMPCAADSSNPPQDGFEMVERDTVIVHLRDKSTGKYALLDWHGTLEGISTAIMGGIEKGQTPEEAALVEIKEEAALEGVKTVRRLSWITGAKYCASHKKQNRKAIAHGLLAEVDNLKKQGKIDEHEAKTHTLIWVDEKDVLEHLTPAHQKLVWQQLNNETALNGEGELMNSDKFNGMESEKAIKEITKKVGGKLTIQYKLHDWLVSRQRYWGAPIPVVYKPTGQIRNSKSETLNNMEIITVDEKELPVMLPTDVDFKPHGESPLASSKTFQKGIEAKYGKGVKRELDTLDTFVCSSWYYLRYCDPHNGKEFAGKKSLKYWMPVDFYVGGAEHTNGHLLYARFITKVLHKLGYLDFDEPFLKLRHQGMIQGEDGEKMSKSRGNVVNPDEVVEHFGADTMRMYEMFIGPFNLSMPWNTKGTVGVRRFLDKVWTKVQGAKGKNETPHQLVAKVTNDLENQKFNTAVSTMMEFINNAEGTSWVRDFTIMLAPFAPHMAEEIWSQVLREKKSIFEAKWPTFDESKTKSDVVTIAVQEYGKFRGTVDVARDEQEAKILKTIAQDDKLVKLTEKYKKHIFVPNKIINFIK